MQNSVINTSWYYRTKRYNSVTTGIAATTIPSFGTYSLCAHLSKISYSNTMLIVKMDRVVFVTVLCLALLCSISSTFISRDILLRKFMFEKICSKTMKNFFNSTSKDVYNFQLFRDKVICAVKCTEVENCVAFAYLANIMSCRLFQETMTNKTNSCSDRDWDYAEVI